ncbi:MAG: hypothetical protein IPG96_12615 [Proteobacteria bacterium]|nr:hypothetical protein [Pseudomonadota bacterium]
MTWTADPAAMTSTLCSMTSPNHATPSCSRRQPLTKVPGVLPAESEKLKLLVCPGSTTSPAASGCRGRPKGSSSPVAPNP